MALGIGIGLSLVLLGKTGPNDDGGVYVLADYVAADYVSP